MTNPAPQIGPKENDESLDSGKKEAPRAAEHKNPEKVAAVAILEKLPREGAKLREEATQAARTATEAAAEAEAEGDGHDKSKEGSVAPQPTKAETSAPASGTKPEGTGDTTWWGTLLGGISVAAGKVKEVLDTLGKSISDGLARLFGKAKEQGQDAVEDFKEKVEEAVKTEKTEKAIYKLSDLLNPKAPVFTFLASKTPRVTSRFGRRKSPDNPGHHEDHNGLDITLAPGDEDVGEPIVANKPLIVQKVGKSKSGANEIVLQDKDHPSRTYGFGHLDELPDLENGMVLEPGALIGKIGNTGRSVGGAHLHFTVRENGRFVDPLSYSGLT